jgi:hypothetical protein
MNNLNFDYMTYLAKKYIWWKTVDEALLFPNSILLQVMNIGDWPDVEKMSETVGEDMLRNVLKSAEAGSLNERSWIYWHYRLGLADLESYPALPSRNFM